MATPSRAEALTQIKERVEMLDELDRFFNSNTEDYITLENALIDALRGDAAGEIMADLDAVRATLSSTVSPAAVQRALAGPMRDFVQAVDEPEGSLAQNMVTFRDNLQDNSDTVNSRDITYASASAGGGNTGDGTINFQSLDKHGQELEATVVETVTFECIQDQSATDEHEEVFEIRGTNATKDFLEVGGSGIRATARAVSARDSESFLTNPSFDSFGGTAPTASTPTVLSTTTEVTGWIVDTAANFEVQLDTTYRGYEGQVNDYALRFKDNGNISQILQNNRAPTFQDEVPYYLQVAVYRESNCDGTLTVEIGGTSQNYTVSTLNNAAWNIVRLDRNSEMFYENFTEANLDVKITLASRTTGTLIVDDVILAPMILVDGLYYLPVGGATSFLKTDTFSFAHAYAAAQPANRGILQYWLAHRSGISEQLGFAYTVPNTTGGTETIADP